MKSLIALLFLVNNFALLLASEFTGTGVGSNAEQARERAWTQAIIQMAIAQHPGVVELTSYSNETLKNQKAERTMIVHIERLDLSGIKVKDSTTEEVPGGFKATTTIFGRATLNDGSKPNDKPEPFHYAKTLGYAKVYIGMSKAAALLAVGEPDEANYYADVKMTQLMYTGKLCQRDDYCFLWIRDDSVQKIENFKARHTEILK